MPDKVSFSLDHLLSRKSSSDSGCFVRVCRIELLTKMKSNEKSKRPLHRGYIPLLKMAHHRRARWC